MRGPCGSEARMRELLGEQGCRWPASITARITPEGTVDPYAVQCACRKPQPGMILQAARDMASTWRHRGSSGDILDDVDAGRQRRLPDGPHRQRQRDRMGAHPERLPHHSRRDLTEAARHDLWGIELATPALGTHGKGTDFNTMTELWPHVDRFADQEVLVIGEAMLDSYLEGTARRFCRKPRAYRQSVAAARTCRGGSQYGCQRQPLGGQVTFCPSWARHGRAAIRAAARRQGVDNRHAHRARQADAGQTARRGSLADDAAARPGQYGGSRPQTEQELIDRLVRRSRSATAVIVSDYCYGILTPRVIETLRGLQAATPRVLVVDAKHLPAYRDGGRNGGQAQLRGSSKAPGHGGFRRQTGPSRPDRRSCRPSPGRNRREDSRCYAGHRRLGHP